MKQTYQPKKLMRKRKHGFLKRIRTETGQRVLKNRRKKKRKRLTR